jgi:hypothetical protein
MTDKTTPSPEGATPLDPDLLRACAAYIAHAYVYHLDGEGELEALRPEARPVAVSRAWPDVPTREDVDALTREHLGAIRHHGRAERPGRAVVGSVATAQAILDAPPVLLAWWCRTLAEGR